MDSVFAADARHAAFLGVALAAFACSSEERRPETKNGPDAHQADAAPEAGPSVDPTPAPEGEPYETLDEWHLFANAVRQAPASDVVPYEVIAQLFSDYAS